MWVYIRTEPRLFTVGFYGPAGEWHTDSDHGSQEEAARRVSWLNGGTGEGFPVSPEEDETFTHLLHAHDDIDWRLVQQGRDAGLSYAEIHASDHQLDRDHDHGGRA